MDRRWNPRKNLQLGVTLEIPSSDRPVTAATLRDISLNGAFIETQASLPSNAPLIIELKFPGTLPQNRFRLNARMVRNAPNGAGVTFVGIPAGVISVLSEVLSQFEQQGDLFHCVYGG